MLLMKIEVIINDIEPLYYKGNLQKYKATFCTDIRAKREKNQRISYRDWLFLFFLLVYQNQYCEGQTSQ